MTTHTLIRWLRRDRTSYPNSEAFHQWRRDCHEWNLRFCGPRRECDSPFDPRWPLNEHNEQALLAYRRQKADFRARGYTWVRPMNDERDEQAWLADWREWHERQR
ncbi:MAG: hypothetical protein M3O92_00685 [Actinomycetota bacterium]|nr:hypothetical protein [Actinomycetota bacterium]